MRIGITAAALGAWLLAGTAQAAVTRSDAGGFELAYTHVVKVAPARAYAGVGEVAQWWDPAHSYGGKASALTLELKPGGCWCEALPGGGVKHGEVMLAWPGRMLRVYAPFGPLQAVAPVAVLTFTFAPATEGTRISTTFRVEGSAARALAGPVDGVMQGQLDRLAAYLNR